VNKHSGAIQLDAINVYMNYMTLENYFYTLVMRIRKAIGATKGTTERIMCSYYLYLIENYGIKTSPDLDMIRVCKFFIRENMLESLDYLVGSKDNQLDAIYKEAI